MSDSFAGTTVRVLVNPAPTDSRPTANHVHKIPGGDVNYLDYGGKKERTIVLGLHFTSLADYNNFAALEGTTGTLICILGTISSATLTDMKENAVVPNKSGGISAIKATGTWTVA